MLCLASGEMLFLNLQPKITQVKSLQRRHAKNIGGKAGESSKGFWVMGNGQSSSSLADA